MKNNIRTWLQNARFAATLQSLIPALMAAVLAIGLPGFKWYLAVLAVIGANLAHCAMNLIDDLEDYKLEVLEARLKVVRNGFKAFTAKYNYLTDGSATVRGLKGAIAVFGGLALACGLGIFVYWGVQTGWDLSKMWVLPAIVLVTAVLGYFYSAPPLKLSFRGFGEIIVGIIFGPLLMVGVFYGCCCEVNAEILFLSVPVGMMVMNILFTHSIIDNEGDEESDKKTLAGVVKRPCLNLSISALLNFSPFVIIVLGVVFGELHWAYLFTLLLVPRAAWLFWSLVKFVRNEEIDVDNPPFYIGRMDYWKEAGERGLRWYLIRWFTARNIVTGFSLIVILINILLLVFGGGGAMVPEKREMDFGKVLGEFSDPSSEYRPAPLWVWNTDVTEADIDRMLGDFKDQGFGGAFVHPRPGLVTEYLSEEWFRLWKYALAKGKELGLDIWIYDENSYPSGFAGGHVPEAMPESYNEGEFLVLSKQNCPADSCYLCVPFNGECYVYDIGYNQPTTWNAGFPYVDLLHKGVTEKFIEVTLEPYRKALAGDFGTSVKGTFSDEPEINAHAGLRWTPDLFECFETRNGYDLRPYLPLLEEASGDYRKIRHDYLATLLDLFIERWSKPMHEYTEKYGLLWTGHYWEHDWPNLSFGPDNMAMYPFHQLPAIDLLFNQFNEENPQAQYGNVRAVKELASVANQMGRKRTLCETYGGGGWEETFADLKRLGDWEYALGVNFMNQHLCHMTITGVRKYDYPDVFTSVSPWFKHYKTLNDYFGRLSLVLSNGEQINDVLILEPTTSIWTEWSYTNSTPKAYEIGKDFQSFVTFLEKNQLEYDLGSEHTIKDYGGVSRGAFKVGCRSYGTVVLPPSMTNIESGTLSLLEKFVAKGGRLVAFSCPSLLDGTPSDAPASLLSESGVLNISNPEELLVLAESDSDLLIRPREGAGMYHHRRHYKDGELIFFANSSLEETAYAAVDIEGKWLYRLDAEKGEISLVSYSRSGGLEFYLELPPCGSALYFASSSEIPGTTGYKVPKPKDNVVYPLTWTSFQRLENNVLTLDFCDLAIEDMVFPELYTIEASRKLFEFSYGTTNPWESSVQFRGNFLDRDTLTRRGASVLYHFDVDPWMPTPVTGMKLVVERPDIWEVSINDNRLESSGVSRIDARMGEFEIGDYVHTGRNYIRLHIPHMNVLAEVAPVLVEGDFCVEPASKGFRIVPLYMWSHPCVIPGQACHETNIPSWKDMGCPMYPYDMRYGNAYELKETGEYALRLGKWSGSVAEVFVDGESRGLIAYPPYALELGVLEEGRHKIDVVVTGTMRNVYGPHYDDSVGITGPWMWNNVKAQAPGSEYRLFEYGLLEPFELVH